MKRLLFVLILFIIIVSLVGLLRPIKLFSNEKRESCKNPTKVEDYSEGKERLLICENLIYYGKSVVATREKYPHLFEYNFSAEEKWEPNFEAVIYSIEDKDFIAVFPVINSQTWYSRAGYIFQKEGESYKIMFERSFESLSGRWTGVRFDENGSIFDPTVIVVNQDLGFMGPLGQVISWSDYYEWNNEKNEYVLANDKLSFRLDEKREKYEEMNSDACKQESGDRSMSKISELYDSRKDMDHFCFKESQAPYISGTQATIFMKARKALEEIRNGENRSFEDVKGIKL